MTASRENCREMYRRMLRIRHFEETVTSLQTRGEIPGTLHTSIGQEAEVVGACMALRQDDYMVGNHRSHGHPIGKGANVNRLMGELLGRQTGVCHGKGGSMHLSDFGIGSLGETSIVGSGLPLATGAALGSRMQRLDRVVLCFFGDGASNEGTFHESLNLASIWRLPVIFLCENNRYAVSTPASAAIAIEHIADRAQAYSMPGAYVDGQDVLAVHAAVTQAAARARAGSGPSLIEAKTYRYDDHAVNLGRPAAYRSAEELAVWKGKDPIRLFRSKLHELFQFGETELAGIEAEVTAEIEAAVRFARESPFPDPAEAFTDVFCEPLGPVTAF